MNLPTAIIQTPCGPLTVRFVGPREIKRHSFTGPEITTEPGARFEATPEAPLTVNGIAYRLNGYACFGPLPGDPPGRVGWHFVGGEGPMIYRADGFAGPTDKARAKLYALVLDACHKAGRPSLFIRAEAVMLYNRAEALHADARMADQSAADLRLAAQKDAARSRELFASLESKVPA